MKTKPRFVLTLGKCLLQFLKKKRKLLFFNLLNVDFLCKGSNRTCRGKNCKKINTNSEKAPTHVPTHAHTSLHPRPTPTHTPTHPHVPPVPHTPTHAPTYPCARAYFTLIFPRLRSFLFIFTLFLLLSSFLI